MAQNGTLNRRQRKFIAALLTARTIEEAAKTAGIGRRTAHRYMDNPAVKAELSRRQDQAVAMSVAALGELSQQAIAALEEALERLGEHARGNLGDFLQIGPDGWTLDLEGAEKAGKLPLVKKLWTDRGGCLRLELHDPQSAAARWARVALDILAERRQVAELEDLAERVARLERLAEEREG